MRMPTTGRKYVNETIYKQVHFRITAKRACRTSSMTWIRAELEEPIELKAGVCAPNCCCVPLSVDQVVIFKEIAPPHSQDGVNTSECKTA
jgi:hypothetical protein